MGEVALVVEAGAVVEVEVEVGAVVEAEVVVAEVDVVGAKGLSSTCHCSFLNLIKKGEGASQCGCWFTVAVLKTENNSATLVAVGSGCKAGGQEFKSLLLMLCENT